MQFVGPFLCIPFHIFVVPSTRCINSVVPDGISDCVKMENLTGFIKNIY